MTVQALVNEIRRLRADERRLVAVELDRLEGRGVMSSGPPHTREEPATAIHWPDRTARRRQIFGEAVLPNVVLEEREHSRW